MHKCSPLISALSSPPSDDWGWFCDPDLGWERVDISDMRDYIREASTIDPEEADELDYPASKIKRKGGWKPIQI